MVSSDDVAVWTCSKLTVFVAWREEIRETSISSSVSICGS